MSQVKNFVISEFTNPSGEIVFRVSGWLDGKRIRKNFPTRPEAVAERQVLEVQRLQGETGIRPAVTRLTEDQLHEAEAAFRRPSGKPQSLSFYLDYALANYREPQHQKLLADAVTAYVAVKTQEHAQKLISASMLTTIKRHMMALKKAFDGPGLTVAELTAACLTDYFKRGKTGLKTYNNRRGLVSTFLKYAENQEWLATNPIRKIPQHRIARRRGSAKTLTAKQAQALMTHVEDSQDGRLVPYFALCLFAGIRPCLRTGEILRLRPEHVKLDTGVIRIEPDVSKVNELRSVTIQPNLAAWLQAYPLSEFSIIVPNLQKLRARIAVRFGLSHDVMRHSSISMHVAKFRSLKNSSGSTPTFKMRIESDGTKAKVYINGSLKYTETFDRLGTNSEMRYGAYHHGSGTAKIRVKTVSFTAP
jgi:integrase